MNLDSETVRLTLDAVAHVGADNFYDRVDYYIQHLPNLSYAMALTMAVYEINKEIN